MLPDPEFESIPFEGPVNLEFELSYSGRCLAAIQRGYQAQDGNEKWSVYFADPWIQIWRPTRVGHCAYALRLGIRADGSLHVSPAWASAYAWSGLGEVLATHQTIVKGLLDFVAGEIGVSPDTPLPDVPFDYGIIKGARGVGGVAFSGVVQTLEDVEKVRLTLCAQVTDLLNQTEPNAKLSDTRSPPCSGSGARAEDIVGKSSSSLESRSSRA